MKNYFITTLMVTAVILSSCNAPQKASVTSPSGDITFSVETPDNSLVYSVKYKQEQIITQSKLGFEFIRAGALGDSIEIIDIHKDSYSGQWEMPWGEKRIVDETYNRLIIDLKETHEPKRVFSMEIRVFDDGIGFRYLFPEQKEMFRAFIADELTEFNFPEDNTAFWIPGDWDIYEHLYTKSTVSEIDATKYRGANLAQTSIPNNATATPITMITPSGTHLSIHEAGLTDYSGMTLKLNEDKNGFISCLVGSDNHEYKVVRETPFETPWRTIQISPDAGGLIESDLIVNLNDPALTDETEWIKPMKYIGIWWDMHLNRRTWDYASGNHGATTEYTKELMDFATEHGFGGVLVEGWNTGWEHWIGFEDREGVFDFVTPYPDYDLEEVVRYGKEKGVELIMHHETSAATETYTKQLDTAYQLMNSLGIHAVKTGYVGKILPKGEYHHGQYMVNHYQKVLEKGLEYQVAINAHEPIKATGKRRTYPNAISREGLRGQEFNAWAEDGGNPPSHLPTVAFTRMLAGPIDFTPGIFDMKLNPYRPDNQINTTLAQQLALYVVIYSPIQMAADLIYNYKNHPAFKFIEDVAVDWEKSVVLNGEVGEYVTIARKEREGERWFVGGITNEKSRDMDIHFDFLEQGKKYRAEIYKDGDNAHWNENPEDYLIENKEVTSESVLNIHLAEGGGFAIALFPL